MIAKLRSWWQQIKRPLLVVGIVAASALMIVLIVGIIGGYLFNWNWTGLRQKTLWDWLQLLFVPGVLTLGAIWFTARQNHDREIARDQYQNESAIALDNQHEEELQQYLDKMSELLLANHLRDSKEDDEVRKLARVRTLTALRRLDVERKGTVLRFLYESGLIEKDKRIIDLSTAWMSGVYLRFADLSRADLSRADFNGANLSRADLHGVNLNQAIMYQANLSQANLHLANLSGAILSTSNLTNLRSRGASLFGADLSGADLSGADLRRADLSGADLSGAHLEGANLQGAKYNTKDIHMKIENGRPVIDPLGTIIIEPTKWPQGFVPTAEMCDLAD